MLRNYYLVIAGLALMAAGCSENTPKKQANTEPAKPQTMQPFTYHKMLEVSPGQYYDVLSWGRGGKGKGALLILHSDSASKEYVTTTGDVDGAIFDVFNSDMDADGNPELLIESKGKDTINYSAIQAYEFTDHAQKLDFPKLQSYQKRGYRGNDNFYMKDGKLIREYPIYTSNDSTAKPTGQKRVLEYSLRSNNLTVKDLSKDTLKVIQQPTAAINNTKKDDKPKESAKSEEKKSSEKSSSKESSKKKSSETSSSHSNKKKKKHHHRS